MIKLISSLLFLVSLQAFSLECEQVKKQYAKKYKKDFIFNDFNSGFSCDSNEAKIIQSILDIDSLVFKRSATGKFYDFYEFVKDRSRYVMFDEAIKAIAVNRHYGGIRLSKRFMNKSRADRLHVLVHEARHSDIFSPRHVMCTKGKMEGLKSCDSMFYNSLSKGGAFNADVVFMYNVVKRSDYSLLSKKIQLSLMKDILVNRFEKIDSWQVKRHWHLKEIKKESVVESQKIDSFAYELKEIKAYVWFKAQSFAHRLKKVSFKENNGNLAISFSFFARNKHREFKFQELVANISWKTVRRVILKLPLKEEHLNELMALAKKQNKTGLRIREHFYRRKL